jgi:methylamine dehydrogenase accessory protein MauD
MDTPFFLSYGALWVLVIGQSLILLGLVRAFYRLQRVAPGDLSAQATMNGGLKGMKAPELYDADVFGEVVDGAKLSGRLRALVFVSPTCASCTVTLEELVALQTKAEGNVIVICRSTSDECRMLAEAYKRRVPVIVDEDFEIGKRFQVTKVPSAVLINQDDRIQAYGHPGRKEELEDTSSVTNENVEEVMA